MGWSTRWTSALLITSLSIIMSKTMALRVAVVSLQQGCGCNSNIYVSEGSSATICARLSYIDGSSTLPRSLVVTLVASDGTAQFLKDYTPGATNLTFPLGSVEGQSLCSNFAIMNDLIAENTETFKVALNTSDPDVTIGDCDGSGVPSLKIYINESDGVQPSTSAPTISPTTTSVCSPTQPVATSCSCSSSSSSTLIPTPTPVVPDRTPPVLTFVRSPLFSNQDITITWTFNKPVNAHCTLLYPSYTALPFPCSTSFSVTNLVAGQYTLFIYAVDLAGSYALEVTHTWTVDLTPPLVYITSYPPASTYYTNWQFAFFCTNKLSCSYQCSVQPSSSPVHYLPCNNGYFLASNLQNGQSYTMSVFAIDAVGNLGSPIQYTWIVDTVPPMIQSLSGFTVSCGDSYDPSVTGAPSFSDSIDPNPSLTHTDNFTSMCTIHRVWTAADAAGNIAVTTQVISFINLQPPQIVAPSDLYVPCAYIQDALQSITPAGVFHPCNRPYTRTYSDSYFQQQCGINFVRTWTVIDDCGQSVTFAQNIHILAQQLPAGPGYNEINVNLYTPLYWPSYVGAIYFYVYIWVQGTNQPAQPVVVINGGNNYVPSISYVPGVTVYWQIQYYTSNNVYVPSPVWGFQTRSYPDLSVVVVSLPLSSFSGQQIQVSWTVTNIGSANTGIYGWTDGIYFGHSSNLQTSALTKTVYIPSRWLDPQESYSYSVTLTLDRSNSGTFYAFVVTDLYRQIQDVNRSNNQKISSSPLNVILRPSADLIVDSISTQSSANSGTNIRITWTVQNDGVGVTDSTFWYDRVYWSTDQNLDYYDRIIGTYGFYGSLLPQTSYQKTITFFVPNAIFGNYYIIVYTDIYNNVYEGTFENNNVGTSSQYQIPETVKLNLKNGSTKSHFPYDPWINSKESSKAVSHLYHVAHSKPYIQVVLTPPPDFIVSQLQCQDTYMTGDKMIISYTVSNIGHGVPFEIFWQDALTMTSVSTGLNYIFNLRAYYGTLYSGGSYTNQVSYYIGAWVPTGSYIVKAYADFYNNVFEYNSKGNNYLSKTLQINQALANLMPYNVMYSISSNAIGNTLQLYYKVADFGTGPTTTPPWGDRVGVSYSSSLYYSSTKILGSFVQSYPLLPNGNYYTRSLTTRVPNGIFGNVYLFVQVDYTNRIAESNKQDNIYTIPLVMPIILPDLSVSSFTIGTSTVPMYAGTTVVFSWTVVNVGTGIAQSVWIDSFYLDSTPLVSYNRIKLADVTVAASLQPTTGYYSRSIGLRLPFNYFGGWYISVNVNNYRTLNENNMFSNNVAVLQLSIVQPPSPDLRVNLVNYNYFRQQRILTVFWNVINNGGPMVATTSWVDKIFLSASPTLRPYNSILIGQTVITAQLQSNQQYSRIKTIILPPTIYGVYYLLLQTDSYNNVMEQNGESNNVGSAGTAYLHPPLSPRLLINFNIGYLPTGLVSGNQIFVTYSVTNIGDYAITTGSWSDGIYFSQSSSDRNLVMARGMLLKRIVNVQQLNAGQTYYVSTYVNIPYGINNILYLVVVIDITSRLGNPSLLLTNVLGASSLPFLIQDGYLADLAVALPPAAVPVSVTSGQPAVITYSVSNVGLRAAVGFWYEALYLSVDAYLDPYDIRLTTVSNLNTLPINSAYTRNINIFIPFGLVSGKYYLFYQVDGGNRIPESNKINNVISKEITMTGTVSADIAVIQVQTSPGFVQHGQAVTFQWKIRNNGAVSAVGYECDTLYLSADAIWDVNDYVLGSLPCRSIAILPYQNNAANDVPYSYTYTVPFISEGTYIGIVQTQTNIRDTNLQNNVGYAITVLQVASLTHAMNIPKVVPFVTGSQALYKIANIPVSRTIVGHVIISGILAYHNIYLKYRTPPTGSTFDGYAQVQLSSQQNAVVTNTKGGEYFISVQSFGSVIQTYTITFLVQVAKFEIFGISPSSATPYGRTTIQFSGTLFSHYIAASIIGNTFGEIRATNVYWYSSVLVYATFDLSIVPPGLYSMRLTDKMAGNTAQLDNCFRVTAGIPGRVVLQASILQTSRTQQMGAVAIHVSNTGGTDMITPLVLVKAPPNRVVQLMGKNTPSSSSSTLGVFLQPSNGPRGYISPGVSVDLQFSVLPPVASSDTVEIIQIQNSVQPHPYVAQKQTLQPIAIPSAVWDLIWSNFMTSVGGTWSTLYTRASDIAIELSLVLRQVYILDTIINYQLHISYGLLTGNSIVSVGDIYGNSATHLQLSIERQYSSYIHKRRTAGPMGMGWLLGWWERRLQFVDSNTIMMWNEREMANFVSNGAGTFTYNNEVITITNYGATYFDLSTNLEYSFDSSSGNLLNIRSVQDSSSIQLTYTNGTVNLLTHSNGQKLNITYDEAGLVAHVDMLDITNTVTKTSLYTYDPSGLYLTAVTIGGQTTAYTYNDNGDLAQVLYSSGQTKVLQYDDKLLLSAVTSYSPTSEGLFSINRTNSWNGSILLTTYPQNTTTTVKYDTAGKIVSYSVDGGLALVEIINSSAKLVYFGSEVIFQQFLEGGYWYLTNANDDTASYQFDQHNHLLVYTDRNGNAYSAMYDGNGTITSLQYPDSTNITLIYDNSGNISSIVNRDGTVSNYDYDSYGNLVQKLLDNDVITYGYSTSRQLIQATNSLGTVTIAYDSSGAPSQINYPNGRTLDYGYENGRRIYLATDSGYNITYNYDTSGSYVTQIVLSNGTAAPVTVVEFLYYASGRVSRKTLGNRQYTTYKYQGVKNRLSEMNTYTSSDILLSSYLYQYDVEGRIVAVTTLDGTLNYTYDGTGQLTGWTNSNGETVLFTYDSNGNRISEVINGVNATYQTNAMNQYLQFNGTDSFVFDQNGNLQKKTTKDGTQLFSFSSESRLLLTQQGTISCNYQYDAMGNLFRKNCSDSSVYEYVVDPFGRTGSDMILEIANGEPTYFIHSPTTGLVALFDDSAISYYHFDPVGSVTHLVRNNEVILNTYKYDPFGRALQQSQQVRNPYQYAGQHGVTRTYELDNMYTMPSGLYDAQYGRFINTDVEGIHRNIQNIYSYALNSPLSQLSPADSTLPAILTELLVGSNSSALLYCLTADLSGDPFWEGYGIVQGALSLKGSYSNTLANRNILPTISTVVGPQKENPLNGAAISSTDQFGILSSTPPLAGAALQRKAYGSLLSQQSAGPIGTLTNMVPTSVLENASQNYTGPITSIPNVDTGGQEPNEVVGLMGIGDAHFVSSNTPLKYTVYFESDSNATLPVQRVYITYPLDTNLDLGTFRLQQIGFSTFTSEVILNMAYIETTYDVTATSGLLVHVKGGIDLTNHQATWELQAMDPATGQPPVNQSVGFLAPNNGTSGQGFVSFTIMAYNQTAGLVQINASAEITLDQNEPYDTQLFFNTIDDVAPTVNLSIVGVGDTNQSVVLDVQASDIGSGVALTSIYEVTANGSINLLTETNTSMAVVLLSSDSSKLFGLPHDNVGNMPRIEEQMNNLLVVNISNIEGLCPGNCLGNGFCSSVGVCLCNDGFIGQNCSEDINECATNDSLGPCEQICTNTYGSFFCSCHVGHLLSGYNCTDIDECATGNNSCSQICNNTIGSYVCSCMTGYLLLNDNDTCKDINECATNAGKGPCDHNCSNTNGSFFCSCLDGYLLSGYVCNDINECANNSGLGPCNQMCTNTNGSFFCSCQPGYSLSGYICNDINECLPSGGQGPCNQTCTNTNGSYYCSCQSGYTQSGYNCTDRNECLANGGMGPCAQICTNTPGSFMCSCQSGFTTMGYNCIDIDECMTGNDNCSQICVNTIGSYICSCMTGYMLSSDNRTCNDINECSTNAGRGPCDQICTNTIGSFSCSCQPGYAISGYTCNDINECAASNGGLGPCDQLCINTNGSFFCSCQPGYSLSGYSCFDINECLPNGGRGPCNQTCTNTNGSFYCSCQSGYTQSGYNCTDINECLPNGGLGPCAQICSNTIGSFVCSCQPGFILSGNDCSDIDECMTGTDNCSQICINTIGSYICSCMTGYMLSSNNRTCDDINECSTNAGRGPCDQICTNTIGSFSCSCQPGYAISGYTCNDINECAASNGGLGPCDQMCTNTNGSFFCSCQPGYSLSGYSCFDINECLPNGGQGPCNQTCTNTNGSFYCSCQSGYTQSGYNCPDINECIPNDGLGPCAQICRNTIGSFVCNCKPGFTSSGNDCNDIDECSMELSGCSQLCVNTIGSYVCGCYPGYQLSSDNQTCAIINLCASNAGKGVCDQICTPTNGSFYCQCLSGFLLNGYSCDDINECASNGGNGPCDQNCTNTIGSFYCSCQSGYTQSGYKCNDINECTPNGGHGPCQQMCTNSNGSYYCSCPAGYSLSGYSCNDINECAPNNGQGPCEQLCTNTNGSFVCSCQQGYDISGYSCYDIDECTLQISGCNQICFNTNGSFLCSCNVGWQLLADNKTCTDISECAPNGGHGPCDQICTNTVGSFSCSCQNGYNATGYSCIDINECAPNGGQGPCNQTCTNTNGSFYCSCQSGYYQSGYNCIDINECAPNGGRGPCDQSCTNTAGSFYCSCSPGYIVSGHNCTDINECAPNNGLGPCSQICTNTQGSFFCRCLAGYNLIGYSCNDIDECLLGISGCTQLCNNTIGGFTCGCSSGYELSSDNKTCTPVNPCSSNGGRGPCEQICYNESTCSCQSGYAISGYNCIDINECASNGGRGPCDQICTNTNGSFLCSCQLGYTQNGYSCIDINECQSNGGRGPCDQICTNTNGSFYCSCQIGYTSNGYNCSDINECTPNGGTGPCAQICTNNIGSFMCSCNPGFMLNGYSCGDIDECSLGTSGCTQNCTNNIGSFTCSCNTGYALASDNKTCNDINECMPNGGLGPCDQICTNTQGSFTCSCLTGYLLSGFVCSDINECAPNGGLGPCDQFCTNTNGSFFCSCSPGYMHILSQYICTDINECVPNGGRGPCDQICTNTNGSFFCSCQSGFSQSGYSCSDINECAPNGGLGPCTQFCTNSIGSFSCTCQPGYTLSGYTCNDIDECSLGLSGCSQECVNTNGSFFCECYPGFQLSSDNRSCITIDECASNSGQGLCQQLCTTTNGSFYCSCLSGYSLSGYNCTDINECASNSGQGLCGQICTNTIGSFSCSCLPGYTQNGYSCIDIDECSPNGGRGPCDQTCTNTNGSFYCSCQPGYNSSGYSCNDINECLLNGGLGPCAQICTNTIGSFSCSCNQGYTLSGYNCFDIDECSLGISGCSQLCNNTMGSFECECYYGYQLSPDNKSCIVIDQCATNGGLGPCDQFCSNTNGSFYCSCRAGYSLSGYTCNDINECAPNGGLGPCDQFCTNTNGSFFCSCSPGYMHILSQYICNDINECSPNGGRGPCDQICTNTNGSFYCSCQPGYNSSGYSCNDINECLSNGGLGPCAQICTNTVGSFSCSCNNGYLLSGYNCYDINECSLGISGCSQLCNNTMGSFECECYYGYHLSSDNKSCIVIDQCASNGGLGPCDQFCSNTNGSFYCSCRAGYSLSGYTCNDINECLPHNGLGPCNQSCTNLIGSFICSCQPGYQLSEYNCRDIDECTLGISGCSQLCQNTYGSFLCGCLTGYTLMPDNNTCLDINECSPNNGSGPCNQSCTNVAGSFYCSCQLGYQLAGYSCIDIDECVLGTSGCSQLCTNTVGSFFCKCLTGYQLSSDNKTCTDINECEPNGGLGPCEQICINTNGSFNCSCQTGYFLSEFRCIDSGQHGAVVHLMGYGGKEDTIIQINISADISPSFAQPNFAIFLTVLPTTVSLDKGNFNGTGWYFIPSEFGQVDVFPPLHYSGSIFFKATSINGNLTDQAFLNITIESVANVPNLSANLSAPCFASANSTLSLSIDASLVDNDGSETLRVFITNLPDSITIPNIERNNDGVYIITNSLKIVQLMLIGTPQVNFTVSAESIEETNGDSAYNNVTKLVMYCPQAPPQPQVIYITVIAVIVILISICIICCILFGLWVALYRRRKYRVEKKQLKAPITLDVKETFQPQSVFIVINEADKLTMLEDTSETKL